VGDLLKKHSQAQLPIRNQSAGSSRSGRKVAPPLESLSWVAAKGLNICRMSEAVNRRTRNPGLFLIGEVARTENIDEDG
jgi:hypothetical protein